MAAKIDIESEPPILVESEVIEGPESKVVEDAELGPKMK